MKQCPQCRSVYSDENLNFCLIDGTALIAAPPSEPIRVELPPEKPPVVETPPVSQINAAPPNGNSKFFLIFAALILGLGIGGAAVLFIVNRNAPPQTAAKNQNVKTKPENTAPKKSNANAVVNTNVNAALQTTPTPKNSPIIVTAKTICTLDDNGVSGGEVNIRFNCDTGDCENDPATIWGKYPNGTKLESLNETVNTPKFSWRKMRLIDEDKNVWVASGKFNCDDDGE